MGKKQKNTPEEFETIEKNLINLGYQYHNRGMYHEYIKENNGSVAVVTFRHMERGNAIRDVEFKVRVDLSIRRIDLANYVDGHLFIVLIPLTKLLTLSEVDAADRKFNRLAERIEATKAEWIEMFTTKGESLLAETT